MNARIASAAVTAALTLAAAPLAAAPTPPRHAALWVAADGRGVVDLLWSPLDGWPAGGFRLERLIGAGAEVVAPQLLPAPELGSDLGDADRELLRRLRAELAAGAGRGEAAATAFLRAALRPAVGEAAGLRARDREQRGVRRYRLTGLDGAGRELWSVESEPVDPSQATPLPARPLGLTATQQDEGLLLAWDPPRAEPPAISPFAFRVERALGAQPFAPLTPDPVVALHGQGASRREHLDADPPPGEARYRLRWFDVLGRGGEPAEIAVTIRDLAALRPPAAVEAAAESGKVTLRWTPSSNAGTSGYRIERSTLAGGPYAPVASAPVPRATASWVDRDVRAGTAYYYRLRSLARDGSEGEPSLVAAATARSAAPPEAPEGLSADAGRTRVRLTWTPVATPIAGYLIERRTATGTWTHLNAELNGEALFDDVVGRQDGGILSYRVTAVGFDSQTSAPSRAIEVRVPDTVAPDAPRLLGIDGAGGQVAIRFAAASPAAATRQMLLLRAGALDESPLVLGEPLAGDAREFVDRFVRAGDEYFYRLVAVDAAGNRSEPSPPLRVRVEMPAMPAAPRPQASWQSKPFPHVRLRFPEPPAGISAVAQRRLGATGDWLQIAEPTTAAEILDVRVPRDSTSVAYRLVLRDATGVASEPSVAVTVEIDRD